MNRTEQTVPCQYCRAPTPTIYTAKCDNCWEIERRTRNLPPGVLLAIVAPKFEDDLEKSYYDFLAKDNQTATGRGSDRDKYKSHVRDFVNRLFNRGWR